MVYRALGIFSFSLIMSHLPYKCRSCLQNVLDYFIIESNECKCVYRYANATHVVLVSNTGNIDVYYRLVNVC